MSIPLVLAALESGLPYREQVVLTQLASHANDDGTSCRPSIDRLASRCGMHRTAVMRATASLEELGWLVRVHMGQRVHYLLDAPRLVALSDRNNRSKRPDESPKATRLCQGSNQDSPDGAGLPERRTGTPQRPAAVPDRDAADAIRWGDLFPDQRERFAQSARALLTQGIGDAEVYLRLRGNVPRQVIRHMREQLQGVSRDAA